MPIKHTYLSGQEVANGFAQITTAFVYSTDNNFTDITGLSLTFTPLQAAVEVRLGAAYFSTNTTGSIPIVAITDSANTSVAFVQGQEITGALVVPLGMMAARLTLTPGTSYTYKGRIQRGLAGASQVSIQATATGPAWIQAVYL